jgi:predicted nucleic acid-binding protein
MSQIIASPHSDVSVMTQNNLEPDHKSGVGFNYYPSGPIDWTPEIGNRLRSFFNEIKDEPKYRLIQEIPFQEPLRSEIRRFLVAVDAWQESNRDQDFSNELKTKILFGTCEGPSYAKELKRSKLASFIKSHGGEFFSQPRDHWIHDQWFEFPTDIGNVFNYQYLIPWREPDQEDYKWGAVPVKIDREALHKFRLCIRRLISDIEPRIIHPFEVLIKTSGSISLSKGQKKANWKAKKEKNQFASRIGVTQRCIIPVGPESYRDTVILEVNSLNRVNLIDYQTFEILSKLDGHIMLSDPDEVTRRYRKFKGADESYYVHRDLRKEGITKPRELLKVMLEELHARFPDAEAYRETCFYDDFAIRLSNGEIFYPSRGHGLGMANALTTLMQLGIMEMIRLFQDEESEILQEFKFLCINDDITVRLTSEDDVETYWNIEEKVLESLSLIRVPEKSFYLKDAFVLAERYYSRFYPNINNKRSYKYREFLNCMCCTNITQAKQIAISASISVGSLVLEKFLPEVVSYWGYEFFKDEYKYPISVGGWFSNKIGGVDLSLKMLDELPFKKELCKAFEACKHNSAQIRYKKTKDKVWLLSGWLNIHEIPERFHDIVNYLTDSEMISKFLRLSENPNLYLKAWVGLNKKRNLVFKKSKLNIGFEELCSEIVKTYRAQEFYPLEFMIKTRIQPKEIGELVVPDLYRAPSPFMSALALWAERPELADLPEDYSCLFSTDMVNHSAQNSELRFRLKTFVGERVIPLLGQMESNFYYTRDDSFTELYRSYKNPQAMCTISSLLDFRAMVPILREEYRNPDIKKKEEIFTRFLTFSEIIHFVQLKLNRREIRQYVQAIDRLYIHFESKQDILEKIAEEIIKAKEDKSGSFTDLAQITESRPYEKTTLQVKISDIEPIEVGPITEEKYPNIFALLEDDEDFNDLDDEVEASESGSLKSGDDPPEEDELTD